MTVKRVLHYRRRSSDVGLVFPRRLKSLEDSDNLLSYTDSDFVGDWADTKSQGGFLFHVYGGPIDWQLKKQLLVIISTTKVEYVACSKATCKVQGLIQLHNDITGELVLQPISCNSNGILKNIWLGVSMLRQSTLIFSFLTVESFTPKV